jgi:flagellar basal body-associated protein FliL
MRKHRLFSVVKRIYLFYYEGFRSMTVGKSLWALIIVKLFLFFVVLKLFFFPNILKTSYDTDEERAAAVRTALSGDDRSTTDYDNK